MTFSGKLNAENISHVNFSDVRAFKNDGLGTNVPVNLFLRPIELVEDRISPEPFDIIISSSPNVLTVNFFCLLPHRTRYWS